MSAFPAADAMVAEYLDIESQMSSPDVISRPENCAVSGVDTPNSAA